MISSGLEVEEIIPVVQNQFYVIHVILKDGYYLGNKISALHC
jgi:hypothetical protein